MRLMVPSAWKNVRLCNKYYKRWYLTFHNILYYRNISNIINSLIKQGAVSVVVKDINGNNKTNNQLVTGDKIEITTDVKEIMEIAISGDINGDGGITASDYVMIKNHIMGNNVLTGVYEKAADYSGDNAITASDYVKIKNYIMGK